jgi:hypothetical protein
LYRLWGTYLSISWRLTWKGTFCKPRWEWGSCYSIFSFICMFCRSLFVLLYLFLFAIVLSVLLRYTVSDWYLQTLLIWVISHLGLQKVPFHVNRHEIDKYVPHNLYKMLMMFHSYYTIILWFYKVQKHTYKTKDRVTRTPLKTGGETSNTHNFKPSRKCKNGLF